MADAPAWGRGAVCRDAALDTLMQDGNEPCEPHYLEQLCLPLLPRTPPTLPNPPLMRALWSSPTHGLLESVDCTVGAPLLIPFASQHNSLHWRRIIGQKDPFGVGTSFTYISKARVRRRSFPGEEKALLKQQRQSFLLSCTCWCGTTDLLSTHGPRCGPERGGNTCMFTVRYLIRTMSLIAITCPCLQDKRNEY